MRPLLIALTFLTRLPLPLRGEVAGPDIGRSLAFYPLVGLLIGALLAAGGWLLMEVSAPLAAALLLALWVLLTGGLHLDGLADSADAWAGGLGDPERTLAIMKDPACGPSGVTMLVLVLLLKWVALTTLLEYGAWEVLLVAPLLGRAAIALLFLTTPYVRPGGLGSALAEWLPRRALGALLAALGLVLVLFSPWPALLGALVMLALLRWLMLSRIGGTTGDTAGATVELVELAALLAAVLALELL